MTTLDDLKRAESAYRTCKERPIKYSGEFDATGSYFWRTAFEWREGWYRRDTSPCATMGFAEWKREGEEGMRLIAENLK